MVRELAALQKHHRDWRLPLAAGGLLSLLAFSALCGIGALPWQPSSAAGSAKGSDPVWTAAQQLDETQKDQCHGYPYLRMRKVLHNNLGNRGPDPGAEGLVLEAMGKIKGQSRRMLVIMNASADYKTAKPEENGYLGRVATVNIKSGSKVTLTISFRDAATGKPLVIENLPLTFFDLDTAVGNACQESVSVPIDGPAGLRNDNYYLSRETQVTSTLTLGERTFQATMHGTMADNPTDIIAMTALQQKRTITLVYAKPEYVKVTLAASHGAGSRFFFFAVKPSLLCALTVPVGEKYPLGDLDYFPPLDTPIFSRPGETFQDWFVEDGEIVEKDHAICTVIKKDGHGYVYRAPRAGTVNIHEKLETGVLIDMAFGIDPAHPRERTIAVISSHPWPPLRRQPDDTIAQSDVGHTFQAFHAKRGDIVKEGHGLVELKDKNGKSVMLKAKGPGVVTRRQDNFLPGDPVEYARDLTLMVVGKFAPLPQSPGQKGVTVVPGMKFERWRANVGDVITRKTPIVDVRDSRDKWHDVIATKDGVLTLRQEGLRWGMKVDEVMKDRTLAVIGKFAPLRVGSGEMATNAHHGMNFVQYNYHKGDYVTPADEVVIVQRAVSPQTGRLFSLRPKISGMVLATHHQLVKGMSIDDSLEDLNLLTVGKLPPLEVGFEQKGVEATSPGAVFQKWRAETGSVVNLRDPIAEIVDSSNQLKVLLAPKYGYLEKRQEALRPGFPIADCMEDRTIAVIGAFPPVVPGPFQTGVEAPQGAIFDGWFVQNGQQVSKGDALAQVIVPSRRLAAAGGGTPKILSGQLSNITAPEGGSMNNMQPLKRGMNIEDALVGEKLYIATVDGSLPFMQIFAVLVCVCLWICFCGLLKVMKKHKPFQDHLLYNPSDSSDIDEPLMDNDGPIRDQEHRPKKREGVRLDFADRASDQVHGEYERVESEYIRSYFAHYRPLGIKSLPKKAPIVVEGFFVNSYAKEKLRVRQHSVLVAIDETDVRDMSCEDTEELLKQRLNPLPVYPLRIRFMDPNAKKDTDKFQTRLYSRRPIGIQFTSDAPIRVSGVDAGSPAGTHEEGPVEVGWYIVGIGDEEVSMNTNFKEVMEYVKEGVHLIDYDQEHAPKRHLC